MPICLYGGAGMRTCGITQTTHKTKQIITFYRSALDMEDDDDDDDP